MIEKVYQLTRSETKTVERLIMDENLHYAHIILPPGETTPPHPSNANVYLTVVRGELTLRLEDQEAKIYEADSLLTIPQGTQMDIRNQGQSALELIIVKAPPPLD
ncbi:MAG: cupin domain-containing protein [Clostridia bacterium]|nr:cupin domain-containing protein [Clostridia bacterium]